ncbi:MAG: tRNA-guanine transglycosylase [Candidatus Aenigmatarchaeota archaeon]
MGKKYPDFLKHNAKKLKLPSYFPVIFPVENSYHVELRIRVLIPQVANCVLISSYNLLKEPKLLFNSTIKNILEKCFVFIDSGGFLLTSVSRNKNDTTVHFNNFNASWKDILKLQNKFAQIGNNVDVICDRNGNISKLIKINSHFIDLYLSMPKNFLFFPTVHAHNMELLKALCKKLSNADYEYDGISVGGLVLLKNDYVKIIERLLYVRSLFDQVPIHVFGIGNPNILPIIYSFGISSVDSASYLKYALDLKYIHPISFQVLNINRLNEKLPCDCKVCTTYSKSDLILMRNTGKAFIAIHNIYAYNKLASLFRNEENDTLENLSKINPFIAKALKIFKKVKGRSWFRIKG